MTIAAMVHQIARVVDHLTAEDDGTRPSHITIAAGPMDVTLHLMWTDGFRQWTRSLRWTTYDLAQPHAVSMLENDVGHALDEYRSKLSNDAPRRLP